MKLVIQALILIALVATEYFIYKLATALFSSGNYFAHHFGGFLFVVGLCLIPFAIKFVMVVGQRKGGKA